MLLANRQENRKEEEEEENEEEAEVTNRRTVRFGMEVSFRQQTLHSKQDT